MSPAYYVGAIAVTENLLKRRWSTVILRHISNGIVTPADMCEREVGLTAATLSERLRTMQRYNLITRHPTRSTIRNMSYRLTSRGQKILKMLTLIEQFDQLEDIIIQNTPNGGFVIYASLAPLSPAADPIPTNPAGPDPIPQA